MMKKTIREARAPINAGETKRQSCMVVQRGQNSCHPVPSQGLPGIPEDIEGWDFEGRDGMRISRDDGISRDFEGWGGILGDGIPFLSRPYPYPVPLYFS
jgi:hypothetical protein